MSLEPGFTDNRIQMTAHLKRGEIMRDLKENQDQKIMTEMTETVEKVEMVEIVGMGETKAKVDPVEISSKSLGPNENPNGPIIFMTN